jgi:site-specific DNA-methyltransferase (adenine-specific)
MSARLIEGDCLAAMREMAERGETAHAVVTDPPYHLSSVVKRFGANDAAPAKVGATGAYARASAGFMGKKWDGGDIAFRPETWRAVWDVLPPGGHLVAFGGTRTFHRMACAIEDAGFGLRDTLMYLYGTGFPKSHSQKGEWEGWGTALKPAWDPIILARKPPAGAVAANVLEYSVGAINVDGCRVPVPGGSPSAKMREAARASGTAPGRQGNYTHTIEDRSSPEAYWRERAGEALGRWPANVLHDGSDEVEAAFAAFGEKTSGTGAVKRATGAGYAPNALGRESRPPGTPNIEYGDSGSASRFFYSAKATAADRAGSKHPTVKPVALMRWLVRLVCPPGGTVLDPFAGSGTTGAAALAEGMRAVLIEQEAEYVADIRRRLGLTRDVADLL